MVKVSKIVKIRQENSVFSPWRDASALTAQATTINMATSGTTVHTLTHLPWIRVCRPCGGLQAGVAVVVDAVKNLPDFFTGT